MRVPPETRRKILRELPREPSELVVQMSDLTIDGWELLLRQTVDGDARRTTLVRGPDDVEKLIIQIALKEDQARAAEHLWYWLEWNELDDLPRLSDPPGGRLAYRTGAGVPPLLYFIQGNATIRVGSNGRSEVDIDAVAGWLSHELGTWDPPPVGAVGEIRMRLVPPDPAVGDRAELIYELPPAPSGSEHLRFRAVGGELALDDDGRVWIDVRSTSVELMAAYVKTAGLEAWGRHAWNV